MKKIKTIWDAIKKCVFKPSTPQSNSSSENKNGYRTLNSSASSLYTRGDTVGRDKVEGDKVEGDKIEKQIIVTPNEKKTDSPPESL